MESGEDQYLSGFKLFMVMFSIILVGFLVLLDTSIVSTVSEHLTHRLSGSPAGLADP